MKPVTKILLLLLLTFPLVPVSSQEASPFRQLPPAQASLVEEYFKVFAKGDSASFRKFWEVYSAQPAPIPLEERLSRNAQVRSMIGAVTPLKVLNADDDQITLQVRSEKQGMLRFEFNLVPGDPPRLRGIGIEQGGTQEVPRAPKSSFDELAEDLDAYLQDEAKADRFSGVVMIVKDWKVEFNKAYGHRDREKKVPNKPDTKFNLGSINKSFTALSIRQLAAKGKLSLDDRIGKFLPDYPNREAAEKVTVQELLDMTSGIGDIFGQRYAEMPKQKLMSVKDFLPLFADQPLLFEPGTQQRYSNGGYIVLGLIIEKVSGMSYYDYVRKNIFEPAGMKETASYPKAENTPNRAEGYTMQDSDGKLKSNYETLPGRGSSAGGGYSTATDLLKYVKALDEAKICAKDDPMRNPFAIAGGAPGINSMLGWDPQRKIVIVVLTNFDPPTAQRVFQQIRSWMPEG